MKLNIDFVREQFPALDKEWTYFDNAGGSQVVKQVVERMGDYLYNTNVQLGASYDISAEAGQRVSEAQFAVTPLSFYLPNQLGYCFQSPV